MKYTVISAKTIDELIQQVNQYIQEGWKPLGGVAIRLAGIPGPPYCQAMVKD